MNSAGLFERVGAGALLIDDINLLADRTASILASAIRNREGTCLLRVLRTDGPICFRLRELTHGSESYCECSVIC